MNFKTPKMKDVTSVALQGASAVAGGMVSNVAVAQIIGDGTKETDPKKFENKKRLVKGVALAVSLAGMAFVQGQDTTAQIVRGALIGAAVEQAISLTREFIDQKNDTSKMFKQAVGLGCPCQEQPLGNPVWFEPVTYSYSVDSITPQTTFEPQKNNRNPLANFSKGQLNGYAKSA